MDLTGSEPQSSITCPQCGYENLPEKVRFCPECGAALLAAPQPGAQIEVSQKVGSVEGGRVVGVDLGQVIGDVNIGNYTLRIGAMHGGVVNLAPPQQQRLPEPRPVPVRLLPRRSPGLLGRKAEVATATMALRSAGSVEFHGPSGIGKTKLLRHLAYQQFVSSFSDGAVHFSGIRHKPVEDLLLDLFDAFYEREATYKPTSVQLRHALQGEQALVMLDDVDLERDEVAELMDAAPNSTFLLASQECCLWGEGQALALQGLPPDDALELLERELGRPLSAEERPAAEALCTVLEGRPLSLLQLAASVKEDGHSLPNLLATLLRGGGPPAEALREQALAACSEQEKQILVVLAVARGASLGKEHVSALTEIEDIDIPIESLKRRKLAQSHGPRCSLTGSLESTLEEEGDLTPWHERALEHFAAWAEQHGENPQHVAEETDAILGILSRALQEERWEGALRLGRAVEGALAVGGQWGAWAQVLGWQFQAARELGDGAAQAWALHQSGTRALCLEHPSTAQIDLSEALRIRESLGDWAGAAVTRHNLEVFFGGPDGTSGQQGNGDGSGGGGGWLPRRPLWRWLIALTSALVVLGLSSSAISSASWPLDSNDFREPAVQLVGPLGPAAQLLKPAMQLLEPAMQPALNDGSSITPWFRPNPNSASSSSNPGGSSGTKPPSDDSSEPSVRETASPSDYSASSGSSTKSRDEDSSSSNSPNVSSYSESSSTKSSDGSGFSSSSSTKSSYTTKPPSAVVVPGKPAPKPQNPGQSQYSGQDKNPPSAVVVPGKPDPKPPNTGQGDESNGSSFAPDPPPGEGDESNGNPSVSEPLSS